jgi:hypothetical protein
MARGTDDDALAWDGDDDPTLDAGAKTNPDAAPAALPKGFSAVGRGSEEVGRIREDGTVVMPGERVPMGNAMLITVGIIGGVYLLYVIGWIIGGLRLQGRAAYLVTDVMYQGSFWLAVLAPVLWFATVFLLTAHAKPWVRVAWLVAGMALLLPWPFVLIGAVGQ